MSTSINVDVNPLNNNNDNNLLNEVFALLGANVISFVFILLINVGIYYCMRDNDTAKQHRKYLVHQSNLSRKHHDAQLATLVHSKQDRSK